MGSSPVDPKLYHLLWLLPLMGFLMACAIVTVAQGY